jgi:hypothetical protein
MALNVGNFVNVAQPSRLRDLGFRISRTDAREGAFRLVLRGCLKSKLAVY